MVARRRTTKRRASKPRRKAPRRNRQRKSSNKQFATILETTTFDKFVSNEATSFNFNLSQFPRASALSVNFKWYKAVKVTWTLTPLYNTFQDGTTGTEVSAPYLYNVMNRTQDSINLTLEDIQAMGAKPTKLTSKRAISYTPNWCSPGLTTFTQDRDRINLVGVTQQGLKAQYSYLACPDDFRLDPNIGEFITPNDPRIPVIGINSGMNSVNANQVMYNGHILYADQLVSTGPDQQPIAQIVATVHWVFKDPHFTKFVGESMKVSQPA
jgi:hypothetical protein